MEGIQSPPYYNLTNLFKQRSMDYRSRRFLIDKIDNKLGSIEKELKFDKIMIIISIALIIVFSITTIISSENHPVLSLICGILDLFSLSLVYTMIKEFIEDMKRSKSQKPS